MSKLPILFLGHGNPMHAISQNTFTHRLKELSVNLPRPRLILCISAHWMSQGMTQGTYITHMAMPKTIHDFYGFPQKLFEVEYPAPGSPLDAEKIKNHLPDFNIQLDDHQWGLDHGTWAVLKHMYPQADIPVLQLSLNMNQGPEYHYQLGQHLRFLREEGVLIIGSGNIVHNLSRIRWEDNAPAYDWALEFDRWVKDKVENNDDAVLVNDATQSASGKLSIPTPDHWYPFLYTLGARDPHDRVITEYESVENGSISMRCIRWD